MEKLKLTKKYKTFSTYKKVGLEWVDQIPQGWSILKLKNIGRFTSSGIDKKLDDNEQKVRMVNYMNVYGNNSSVIGENTNFSITTTNLGKIRSHSLKKGDILFTPSSETVEDLGVSAVVINDLSDVIYSYHLTRFRPKRNVLDLEYSKYIAKNKFVLSQFSSLGTGTTRQVLNRMDFKNTLVFVPSMDEQLKIAHFLDKNTNLIDNIISKKKKQIELLQEKRTSIINNAVTKGINFNANLVRTEVDWLDKLSAEFHKILLKRVLKIKITDGPHTTPVLLEKGIPFISAESIQANNTIDFNKKRGYISIEDHVEFCKKTKPELNDIFMVKSGATTGRYALVETQEDFSIWSPLALIRADKNKILPKYLYYFIGSSLFQDQVKFSWSFGTQQNIGMKVIENLFVFYPNVNSQKAIVEYLDKSVSNLEESVRIIDKSISLLKEFKISLISNVVTGKVKI